VAQRVVLVELEPPLELLDRLELVALVAQVDRFVIECVGRGHGRAPEQAVSARTPSPSVLQSNGAYPLRSTVRRMTDPADWSIASGRDEVTNPRRVRSTVGPRSRAFRYCLESHFTQRASSPTARRARSGNS